MSSLSNVEARLPPGFRFHPRDEELVCDYLVKWITGCPLPFPSLIEVDLNKCEPWDIPESACVGGKEWYFYSQRDRKYATGLRTNRATISGYWKATGKDRPVTRKGALVGMRKTLVFYQGRAPKGRKTDWVMHEFRIHGPGPKFTPPAKGDWVLCRVLVKSRAEIIQQGKGEHSHDATSSSLQGGTMEAYSMSFDQGDQGEVCASANDHHYHQQVPCFSIFSPMAPPPITPNQTCFGFYDDNDHKTIKAVLNRLTKTENDEPNDLMMMMKKMKGCSPSLGEGSSECSYLSDVGGLSSSVWNHY